MPILEALFNCADRFLNLSERYIVSYDQYRKSLVHRLTSAFPETVYTRVASASWFLYEVDEFRFIGTSFQRNLEELQHTDTVAIVDFTDVGYGRHSSSRIRIRKEIRSRRLEIVHMFHNGVEIGKPKLLTTLSFDKQVHEFISEFIRLGIRLS
jgi:hypothetical protein